MSFKRVFKWLTFASLVALLVLLLRAGPHSVEDLVGVAIFFPWLGGPLALPYLLSWSDREGVVRGWFFAFFLAAAGFTFWQFYELARADSSTAGLALIFAPLWTWGGLLLLSCVLAVATGWRPTLSGPDGSA